MRILILIICVCSSWLSPNVEGLTITGETGSCSCDATSEELDCTGRRIRTEDLSDALGGQGFGFYCPQLTQIVLRQNLLTDLPSFAFNNLPLLSDLFLYENALTEVPSAISNLTSLSYLDISSNSITAVSPGSFFSCPSLYIVYIYSNSLTTLVPDALSNLPSLYYISFLYNPITTISPGAFSNLPSLYEIDLYSTPLSSIPAGAFKDLPSLSVLGLLNNSITYISPGAFSNLPALAKVFLGNNMIESIPAGIFVDLPALTYLDLSLNSITMLEPKSFCNLTKLYELFLFNNSITSIPAQAFYDLPSLSYIDASTNSISNIFSGSFSDLPSLQSLYLYRNRISEIPLGAFSNLPLLNALTLFENSLIDLDSFSRADLPSLQNLQIQLNNLTKLPDTLPSSLRQLLAFSNNISIVPRSLGPVLDNLTLFNLENNPSVCHRVLDPITKTIKRICDCSNGFYGIDFCESIRENFVVLPSISSALAGFKVDSPLLLKNKTEIPFYVNDIYYHVLVLNLILYNSENVSVPAFVTHSMFFMQGSINSSANLTQPLNPFVFELSSSINEPLLSARYSTQGNLLFAYFIEYSLSEAVRRKFQDLGLALTSNSNANYFTIEGLPKASVFNFTFNVTATEVFSTETRTAATVTLSVKDCGNYTCHNGGFCVDDGDYYNNNYTCLCQPRYRGHQCETFDAVPPIIQQCLPSRVLVLPEGESEYSFSNHDALGNFSASDESGSVYAEYYYAPILLPGSNFSVQQAPVVFPFLLSEGEYAVTLVVLDAASNNQSCKFYLTLVQSFLESSSQIIVDQGTPISSFRLINLANLTVIYTVTDVRASLPLGAYVDPRSGQLVGTPTDVIYNSSVLMRICDPRDATGVCGEQSFLISVRPFSVSTLSSSSLQNGAVGSSFLFSFSRPMIIGGGGCTTYLLNDGELPQGLTMEPTTGTISGTPLYAVKQQSFTVLAKDISSEITVPFNGNTTFTISIQDCDNTTCVNGNCIDLVPFDNSFNCSCNPLFVPDPQTGKCTLPADNLPPEIITCLPSKVFLVEYPIVSTSISVTSLGAYNITDDSGSFQVKYSYASGSSSLFVPIATFPFSLQTGSYQFKLTASDSSENSIYCTFYVSVLQVMVNASTLIQRSQGTPSDPFVLVDVGQSSGLYSMTDVSGSLPDGLYLNSLSGELAGTPMVPAPLSEILVRVCDSRNPLTVCGDLEFRVVVSSYIVNIAPQISPSARRAIRINAAFPSATYNKFYSTSPFNTSSAYISGGSGCVTFQVVGALPAGLKMLADGSIQGVAANYSVSETRFRVLATDASRVSVFVNANQTFNVMVNDCSDSISCGNGTCIDVNPNDGMYSCQCVEGYVFEKSTRSCELSIQSAKNRGISTGTLAGVISGAILLLGLVILIAWLAYKRALRGRPHDFKSMLAMLDGLDFEGEAPKQPRELKRAWLTILEELGRGNFGTVSKAMFEEHHGALGVRVPGFPVAVKTPREEDSFAKKDLLREALTMAQFSHPNVVTLIGVVTMGQPVMIVMEFLEKGNLNSYIRHTEVSPKQKISWACEIASGLAYLVARQFVHRDVATRNVLLDVNLKPKIADFGMSRDTSDEKDYYRSVNGAMALRWCAPEVLQERKFSQASDVWAFGVLLYELWTHGDIPYRGWANEKVCYELLAGFRLPSPDHCPTQVTMVMKACWATIPSERPVFALIPRLLSDPLELRRHSRTNDIAEIEPEYANFNISEASVSEDLSHKEREDEDEKALFGSLDVPPAEDSQLEEDNNSRGNIRIIDDTHSIEMDSIIDQDAVLYDPLPLAVPLPHESSVKHLLDGGSELELDTAI